METKLQIWSHRVSGERYVVALKPTTTVEGGLKTVGYKVAAAAEPLHYSEIPAALQGAFDSDPEVTDDINNDQDSYAIASNLDDFDVYLVLVEEFSGYRSWFVVSDPAASVNRADKAAVRVLGPATIGPSGYDCDDNAGVALADLNGVDLNDPASWPMVDPDRDPSFDR